MSQKSNKTISLVFEETNIKVYCCVKDEYWPPLRLSQYHLSHTNKS